jgi:glutathione S-transferase
MLELYQTEWCPFSHRVRQKLTELGLGFIAHQVEPNPPERDTMRAAVGADVIPVLVLDDGTVLDQDADGIIAELDARYPGNPHTAEHHERRIEALAFER